MGVLSPELLPDLGPDSRSVSFLFSFHFSLLTLHGSSPGTLQQNGHAPRAGVRDFLCGVILWIPVVVVVRHLGIDGVEDEAEDVDLALVEGVKGVFRQPGGGELRADDHEGAVEIRGERGGVVGGEDGGGVEDDEVVGFLEFIEEGEEDGLEQ